MPNEHRLFLSDRWIMLIIPVSNSKNFKDINQAISIRNITKSHPRNVVHLSKNMYVTIRLVLVLINMQCDRLVQILRVHCRRHTNVMCCRVTSAALLWRTYHHRTYSRRRLLQQHLCTFATEQKCSHAHDDVMALKHFPRYWPNCQGNPTQRVGDWCRALMISLSPVYKLLNKQSSCQWT